MTTVALTEEQYRTLIADIRAGDDYHRPNDRVATALVLEANMGMRISDVLNLRLADIIRDGTRFRLDVVEQKTHKPRTFTVPEELYRFIRRYCERHGVGEHQRIFPFTSRAVEKRLRFAADKYGYANIGTHSFRKFYATRIYTANNYNIVLVQRLLQHSSPTTTQRYIGIGTEELERAIRGSLELV